MADFPTTIRKSDWDLFSQVRVKKQVRTRMESGVVQSRALYTASKWLFKIGWKYLTTSEYDTLVTFFDANLGGSFNFTHPITDVVYVVRFTQDNLPESPPIGEDYWSLSGLELEEV